jgi:hypothetical protein
MESEPKRVEGDSMRLEPRTDGALNIVIVDDSGEETWFPMLGEQIVALRDYFTNWLIEESVEHGMAFDLDEDEILELDDELSELIAEAASEE